MTPLRPPTPTYRTLVAVGLWAGMLACAPARRHEASTALAAAGGAAPAPERVRVPAPWDDPFFAEVPALAAALKSVRDDLELAPGSGMSGRFTPVEAWARDEARADGRRDVRTLYAYLAISQVGAAPGLLADAILDPARERPALDADAFVELARAATPQGERRAYEIALLRMGEGPFRADFRWDLEIARRDRADGSVLLRYERSTARGPGLHASLFRGAAVLLPEASGTRWVEVLAVASDIRPPFFLVGRVEAAVESILGRRWKRLSGPAPAK